LRIQTQFQEILLQTLNRIPNCVLLKAELKEPVTEQPSEAVLLVGNRWSAMESSEPLSGLDNGLKDFDSSVV